MIRSLAMLFAMLVLSAVLGCGNKGPLYLPQEASESQPETEEEQQKP